MAVINQDSSKDTPSQGATAPAARRDTQRPAAKRERKENFGGLRLKLAVAGTIEGYHLYWANNDAGEIESLLNEGFEFVEPSEVNLNSHFVSDEDNSNRVSRFVGKDAEGKALRAYLLKCPDEVWDDRQANGQEQADLWDEGIHDKQHQDGMYAPKSVKTSVKSTLFKENK
jgi:hypothetical protein